MSLKGAVIFTTVSAIALGIVVTAIVIPYVAPNALFPQVYSTTDPTEKDVKNARLQIDIRKSILDWMQIIFSAATAAGLVGTLFYTARNYQIASENLRVTEFSKFSEAYFKASDLMGSEDENTVIGAIRALGRLALSSPNDHRYVMNILCDYLRRNARHTIGASGEPRDMAEVKPQIQAVLDVIRHRRSDWDSRTDPIDLSAVRPGAGASLVGVSLESAIIKDADFRGVILRGANLRKVNFSGTLLNSAVFDGSDLRWADLQRANLDAAQLVSVKFRGAKVDGACGSVTHTHTKLSRRQRNSPDIEWI